MSFAFILNPYQNGSVPTYTTTKELEKKAFKINSWNIKLATDIQVTFMIEKKLQKEHFLVKNYCLLSELCVHFKLLLGLECTYLYHD